MQFLIVFISTFLAAQASMAFDCSYPIGDRKETFAVSFMGQQQEILQLHDKSAGTDQYLRLSKLEKNGADRVYVLFATRENSKSFLRMDDRARIRLTQIMSAEGNRYRYTKGKTEINVQ
jgi:hypothetical protein